MTDVAAQATEQNRFETIRNSIPVQLRPTAVPHPLTNLSTERNEEIDRLYHRVENRPPSDRFADGYFVDEVQTVTKSAGFELEFVPEGNIRLSSDRKYGFVVGPNGFLKNDASYESNRDQERLPFVLSTPTGGRQCCGYYSYVDVELEPLSPHELQYPRLAEQLRNQHGGGPVECTAIVLHRFADGVKAIIQDVTCPDPRQQGPPDQFSVPTRAGPPAERAVQATSATSARSSTQPHVNTVPRQYPETPTPSSGDIEARPLSSSVRRTTTGDLSTKDTGQPRLPPTLIPGSAVLRLVDQPHRPAI